MDTRRVWPAGLPWLSSTVHSALDNHRDLSAGLLHKFGVDLGEVLIGASSIWMTLSPLWNAGSRGRPACRAANPAFGRATFSILDQPRGRAVADADDEGAVRRVGLDDDRQRIFDARPPHQQFHAFFR